MPIDGPVAMPPAIYQEVEARCRPSSKPALELAVIRIEQNDVRAKVRCPVVVEEVRPVEDVARTCLEWSVKYKFAAPPAGQRFLGCMLLWTDGRCKVLRIDREDVRQHELAHCAGWPADHPGGGPVAVERPAFARER